MSWYINSAPIVASEFDATVDAMEIVTLPTYAPAETLEQFAAAKEAAKQLFHSGALGSQDTGEFRVQLSGHANPGHINETGWSPDTIAITVNRVS